MADYQAQIRLAVQGLSQLDQLERRLGRATELLGRLEGGSANVGQAASSAQRRVDAAARRRALAGRDVRNASQTVENVAQRRDSSGRFMAGGPNATARRLAAANLRLAQREARESDRALREELRNRRLISAAQRRYAAAIDRATGIIGAVQGGVSDQQARIAQTQARIGRESRINYLTNLFTSRERRFQREGGGLAVDTKLNTNLRQQAQNVRAAWDVATAAGKENLQLMQRLATEMTGIDQEQREFNQTAAGRSKVFRDAVNLQERLDKIAQMQGADPAKIRRLRALPADAIAASNRGDVTGGRDAIRAAKDSIARYGRELEAAAAALREQQRAAAKNLDRNRNWQRALDEGAQAVRLASRALPSDKALAARVANSQQPQPTRLDDLKAEADRRQAEQAKRAAGAVGRFATVTEREAKRLERLGIGQPARVGGRQQTRARDGAIPMGGTNGRPFNTLPFPAGPGNPRGIAQFREIQRQQRLRAGRGGLFQGNLREAISSGLIGGGFPLLFGQGLGGAVGGGVGGAAGGFLGGGFGFGVSVVGTALGAAVDTTVANLKNLAGALKGPDDALAALEQSGFRVSDSLRFQVQSLQAVGRAYDAQTLVLQEVERRLGEGSARELNALNTEQKRLQEQWARLTGELQSELLPVLIAVTGLVTTLAERLSLVKIPEALLRALGPVAGATELGGRLLFRGAQNRGREIAAGPAGDRQSLTPQEQFEAESTRIQEARKLADLQRDIERGERDLLRRKEDIEFSIIDQRRAESDYEREVAEFRWSLEQRVLEARTQAIRAELDVAKTRSEIRVAEIGLDFDQRIFEAPTDRQKEILEATKNFLQTQEQTENTIQQNKIETELRIEQLKQDQINRERQLEREKEQLERRKDELLRGRVQIERSIADYQMSVADYQRETAEKILDAWRQMQNEMQASSAIVGGTGGGNLGGTQLSRLIGSTESYGGNYGAFNRGGSNRGHTAHGSGIDPNLTGMTIAEIQRRQLAPGVPRSQQLHAVGKYQIIGTTLRGLVNRGVASPNERFTPEVQERLGASLARARVMGKSVEEGMRGLRQEWIGLQYVPDAQLRAAVIELQSGGAALPAQGANLTGGRGGNMGSLRAPTESQSALTAAMTQARTTSIPAPQRPAAPNLPGVPDTAPMERGIADANTRTTAAVRAAEELLQRLQETRQQAAFDNLRRAIQGDSGLQEARERLKVEQFLLNAGIGRNELERERIELAAAQNIEYQNAKELLLSVNRIIDELAADNLAPERVAELRRANSIGLEQTTDRLALDRETFETSKLRDFQDAMDELGLQAERTGAGLRAGLIGPMAEAFEEARRRGYDTTETQQFVEAAKRLQDQQLIWNNLTKDIVATSDAIAGGLTQGLADVITGARTMKEVGREVLASIAGTFLDSAQQQLSAFIQRSAASLFGGFFGGPSLLPFSFLPGLATGGPASAGKPYLVGEEGPELFIPGISGRVLSANETADYLSDAEIRALEDAAEAADGSTGIGGTSTTNVDARRTSNRSDTSQRFDSSSTSSYVQQQAKNMAMAAGKGGDSTSTSSDSSLFNDTREMINTASAVMQQRESESSIMEAVRADSEQGRSVTVEWRKVGDLDVVTREQLIGAMTQAERRGARKGKEMVLSGVKRDPAFRRQMR